MPLLVTYYILLPLSVAEQTTSSWLEHCVSRFQGKQAVRLSKKDEMEVGWGLMFPKNVQVGMKMACASDLTPVKGLEVGNKMEKRESLRSWWAWQIWPIWWVALEQRSPTYWRSFALARNVHSTATEFRHCPGAAQEKSGLSSKTCCRFQSATTRHARLTVLLPAALCALSWMKIWAVHPIAHHSPPLHLMDSLLHVPF